MSIHAISPSIIAAPPPRAPARAKSPWLLALLFAVAAAASGILLTGISVWFLGAVALAGLGPAALAFNRRSRGHSCFGRKKCLLSVGTLPSATISAWWFFRPKALRPR